MLVEFWALRLVLSKHAAQRPSSLSSLFAANALECRRHDPLHEAAAAATASGSRRCGASVGGSGDRPAPPDTSAAEAASDGSRRGRKESRAGKAERRKRKAEMRAERRERKRRRRRRRGSSSDSDVSDSLPHGISGGIEREARWEVIVGRRRLQFADSQAADELSAAAVQTWLEWVWKTIERA